MLRITRRIHHFCARSTLRETQPTHDQRERRMRCLHVALSLLALADALGIPVALAQEPDARPILRTTPGDWSVEVVTEDLNYPWDINQVGNRIVMTEAGGNIVMIENGRLDRYAIATSDPIVHDGGAGSSEWHSRRTSRRVDLRICTTPTVPVPA
jgi:glucose/arabinose dehydrogenase